MRVSTFGPSWLLALAVLVAGRKKTLHAPTVFKAIDSDADGRVSSEEIASYLKDNKRHKFEARHSNTIDSQRKRIQNLVEQLDTDRDGEVSHDEFPRMAHYHDKQVFHKADADGNGRLSGDEIIGHQAAANSPDAMMERASKKVMNDVDKNADGGLSQDEFSEHIELVKQHFLHHDEF